MTQQVLPRDYVRKRDRVFWSEGNLCLASEDVKSGKMTLWNVSKIYQIPYRTLKRRIKSKNFVKGSPGHGGLC